MRALGRGVECGAPGRAFHLALDPGLLVGILDVHELDADRAAIGLAQDGLDFAQRRGFAAQHVVDEDRLVEVVVGEAVGARIELGVRAGDLQAERVEPRLQMAAHAIGADQHQRAQRGDGGGADLLAGLQHGRRRARRLGRRPDAPPPRTRDDAAPRRRRSPPPAPRAHRRSARRTVRRRSDRRNAGSAAQRAYCSPRNAAFAPLNAEARMSTPAIRQNPSLDRGSLRLDGRAYPATQCRTGTRRVASSAWPLSGK